MKKKRHIIEVIGSKIEKYGFSFDQSWSDSMIWTFSREVGSVKQMVLIQEKRFAKGLILKFQTSVTGLWPNEAVHIIPKDKRPPLDEEGEKRRQFILENPIQNLPSGLEQDLSRLDYNHYWSYNNEETFIQILEKFAEIIELYGLTELERMSETKPERKKS